MINESHHIILVIIILQFDVILAAVVIKKIIDFLCMLQSIWFGTLFHNVCLFVGYILQEYLLRSGAPLWFSLRPSVCPSVRPSICGLDNSRTDWDIELKFGIHVYDLKGFHEFGDGPCRTISKGRRPRAHPPRFFLTKHIGYRKKAKNMGETIAMFKIWNMSLLARKFKFKYLFSSNRSIFKIFGVHGLQKIQKRLNFKNLKILARKFKFFSFFEKWL